MLLLRARDFFPPNHGGNEAKKDPLVQFVVFSNF